MRDEISTSNNCKIFSNKQIMRDDHMFCIAAGMSENFCNYYFISLIFLVPPCSIGNGGCSNNCINPSSPGQVATCSCSGSALVLSPSNPTQCGKSH